MGRRFQFRLKTLFVLTALVGLGCVVGAFAVKKYQAWSRRERIRLQRLETLDKVDGPDLRSLGR